MRILIILLFNLLNVFNCNASSLICDTSTTSKLDSRGLLYSIRTDGKRIGFLFGSLHVGVSTIKTLPKLVSEAVMESDQLVIETKLDNKEADELTNGLRFLPLNTSINKILSPDVYKKFRLYVETLNIPNSAKLNIDQITPNLAMQFIDITPTELDNSPSLSILLEQAAKKANISINGLESVEDQLSGMRLIRDIDWNDYVKEMLNISECEVCVANRAIFTSCMLELVRIGDADALTSMFDQFYSHYPARENIDKKILYSRNVGMAKKIDLQLRKHQNLFFDIGALHLGGRYGVVEKLRGLGYQVDQVK